MIDDRHSDFESFFDNSELFFVGEYGDIDGERSIPKKHNEMRLNIDVAELESNGVIGGSLSIMAINGLKDGTIILKVISTESSSVDCSKFDAMPPLDKQIEGLKGHLPCSEFLDNYKKGIVPKQVTKNQIVHKKQASKRQVKEKVADTGRGWMKTALTENGQNVSSREINANIDDTVQSNENIRRKESNGDSIYKKVLMKNNQSSAREPMLHSSPEYQEVKDINPIDKIESISNVPTSRYLKREKVIMEKEIEIFSIDRSFKKQLIAVLPFKINLNEVLVPSCDHHFDLFGKCKNPYKSSIWSDIPTSDNKKTAFSINKSNFQKISPSIDSSEHEYYRISHKLIFYYVTKTANLNWQRDIRESIWKCESILIEDQPEDLDSARDIRTQYEDLKYSKGFMKEIRSISVSEKRKIQTMDLDQVIDSSVSTKKTVQFQINNFLCCRKRVNPSCRLLLDKTTLNKSDRSICIKLEYERGILDKYLYIDTVIYTTFKRHDDNGQDVVSHSILQYSSHNIYTPVIPGGQIAGVSNFEYDLDVEGLNSRIFTFESDTMSISCGIKVFLSKHPHKFETEILDRGLSLPLPQMKVKPRSWGLVANYIWSRLDRINQQETRGVLLPHTTIDLDCFVQKATIII